MDNTKEESIPTWINHFERQARTGLSKRSTFNNRVIIVHKENKKKYSDNSSGKTEAVEKIPDLVSPVQQVIDQAEEEIRREKEEEKEGEEEEKSSIKYNNNKKLTVKRKRTIKGKLSSKKFKDIFSKV
jgi:hypothetical protein